MPFSAGRYHRVPYHEYEEAKRQLKVQFYEYVEWLTFDEYMDVLQVFKHLGTDYWYAHQDTDRNMDGQNKCLFGFVNQKDAVAFKLIIC